MTSSDALAPTNSFAGRTVIVTGGAGSIGRPLSLAFARAGANVVVNDLGGDSTGSGSSSSPAHTVVADIHRLGGSAVADTHSVLEAEAILRTAIQAFGRIDVIVNNAGIGKHGPVEAMDPKTFQQVFEINALAPMALLHYAWPHFQAQSYGRVINFTSTSVFGMPNASPYVLSRGAMLGITRTLALEGAPHNIRVNTVGPTSYSRMVLDLLRGLPDEQQITMKETYTGESNVPLILALASEKCEITGQIFSTGGYAIGRLVLGTVLEIKDCRTMTEVQQKLPELCKPSRESIEPMTIMEYVDFHAEET